MDFLQVIWDDENDPHGNVEHIAEHGLTMDDVDFVLTHPVSEGISKSSGMPIIWGFTPDETYIMVVYEQIDAETIRVITAYEVSEP